MAIDVRRLRPAELVRLLNSTPLGEVQNEHRLYRQRSRAGLRIGDGKTIDLLRYTAWLARERHLAEIETPTAGASYETHKERARERQAELSRSGRDIGEIPPVVHQDWKDEAERNFRFFCEKYFAPTFCLPWSPDHLRVINLIETVVLDGGLFAVAMPRGNGKTSLCEAATIWSLLYGHRPFVAVVGPDEDHARDRVKNLRSAIEFSDELHDDFPEVCYPIRKLEGINQRRLLYQGKPIRMEFTAKRIILPQLPNSRASGGIVATAGITGQIRGMNYRLEDGSVLRPSLVILDDPQTDESAHSPSQCAQRERILNGAILGLAGPGTKIAAIMPCTVVRPDDMADRILDRKKNPQWQGERTKMVYAWPTREDMWEKYVELRRGAQELQQPPTAANELYRQNLEVMNEGSKVAWNERHGPDELSAIQHAWNIRADRGDAAFFAEYQNDPLPEDSLDDELLTVEQIAAKVNGHERGEIPIGATALTMFVDVQEKALFWLLAAWEPNFTGYVVDYGTEPDQRREYFSLRDVRQTLAMAAPNAGFEGSIYAGLERLVDRLLGREWRRDDGAMVRVDRCLVDANWGRSTEVVYKFCRQSRFAGIVLPSHGRYVGASSIPFSEYKRKPGDRVGMNWRIPVIAGKRAVRHVLFDTNFWKSFIQSRLAVPMGDPGCLSLFGRPSKTRPLHQLFGEHLTSEYRVKTQGRGRTVDEWKSKADGLDNHWLDCLVGAAVAAAMQGAAPPGVDAAPLKPKRRRVSFAELQRAARDRAASSGGFGP